MKKKVGKLTPQQIDFARVFANTDDQRYSALKAGYAAPDVAGSQLVRHEGVQRIVNSLRESRELLDNALPAIIAEHKRRLLDPMTTNREFSALVTPFYKHSGLKTGDEAQKEAHEMTAAELAREIEKLEHEAAGRAKVVEATVVPETEADLFE